MSDDRRVLRAVYEPAEFNALRLRLPRAQRDRVGPAPSDHLGLVVQIVTPDDYPLATVRGHVPANADLGHELSLLETRAYEQLA
jgi:hypothetical protein